MYSSGRRYIFVATLYAAIAIIVLIPIGTGFPVFNQRILSEACAQTEVPSESKTPEATPEGDTIIDRYHRNLSEDIVGIANWIDSFFDNDRTVAEDNKTRLRIKLYSFMEEGVKPVL